MITVIKPMASYSTVHSGSRVWTRRIVLRVLLTVSFAFYATDGFAEDVYSSQTSLTPQSSSAAGSIGGIMTPESTQVSPGGAATQSISIVEEL